MQSSLCWVVEVNGRHSSPYNNMDSTADWQRPILIASFALGLKNERKLVSAMVYGIALDYFTICKKCISNYSMSYIQ